MLGKKSCLETVLKAVMSRKSGNFWSIICALFAWVIWVKFFFSFLLGNRISSLTPLLKQLCIVHKVSSFLFAERLIFLLSRTCSSRIFNKHFYEIAWKCVIYNLSIHLCTLDKKKKNLVHSTCWINAKSQLFENSLRFCLYDVPPTNTNFDHKIANGPFDVNHIIVCVLLPLQFNL